MYLTVDLNLMIPKIKGITEVQRKGKKAFSDLIDKKGEKGVIFLADRNKIFAVVLSVQEYEKMINNQSLRDDSSWLKACESSLDFWNDPSNDAYEKLIQTDK